MATYVTRKDGSRVRVGSHGYVYVTKEDYERSRFPYPHPHYPDIMVGTGPIMQAVNSSIQLRYAQQLLDGDTE